MDTGISSRDGSQVQGNTGRGWVPKFLPVTFPDLFGRVAGLWQGDKSPPQSCNKNAEMAIGCAYGPPKQYVFFFLIMYIDINILQHWQNTPMTVGEHI